MRFLVLWWLFGSSIGFLVRAFQQQKLPQCSTNTNLSRKLQQRQCRRTSFRLYASGSNRENEIRRKIQQLKRQGKIANNNPESSTSSYDAKVREKLGASKSKMLGFNTEEIDAIQAIQNELDADGEEEEYESTMEVASTTTTTTTTPPRGRIGSLPAEPTTTEPVPFSSYETVSKDTTTTGSSSKPFSFNPTIFPESKGEEPEMTEEELLQLVTAKLAEKQQAEARQRLVEQEERAAAAAAAAAASATSQPTEARRPGMTTSGVGGTWQKEDDDEASKDLYKPKSGSWGAFPR